MEKRVKVLLVVILIAVIVAALYLTLRNAGYVTSTSACTDSDNGTNYYVKGKCTDSLYPAGINDSCYTTNQVNYSNVKEMFCNTNGQCQAQIYQCPYDCKNGVCITNTSDTAPPLITGVGAGASGFSLNSAKIGWSTNENSNSTVRYGRSSTNLNLIASSPAFVKSHSVLLSNLSSSTIYFYAVTSCDTSSNCAKSSIKNFMTNSCSWIRRFLRLC